MQKNSQGLNALYTLFMGQPIKKEKVKIYDFITYYFWLRCKEKREVPNGATLSWVYGEFLWGEEIVSVLESEYSKVKPEKYEELLRGFRKKAIKKIVEYMDPMYPKDWETDFITLDDISYFLQMVARTKIWKDTEIKINEPLIREFANAVSIKNYNAEEDYDNFYISNTGEFDGIDWFNKELPLTSEYEFLEKENWKNYTLPEFHPFIDAINLTQFKKLLKDPLKRHFLPMGRQAEFLLRHKRFNRIWASRRSWKCRYEEDYIRLYSWEFRQAKEICVWDKLLASDKTSFTTVKDVEKFQKECVRVKLSDGTSFIVSKDHRIPTQATYRNGKRDMNIDSYKRAENLTPEDFVPTMFDIGIEWVWGSFDEWLLVWLLLWDWSLTTSTPRITCYDKERRKFVYKLLDRLWYKYSFIWGEDVSILWLSKFRDKYDLYWVTRDKKIPNKIFWMSKEMKWGVINWLLYTDWYLSVRLGRKHKDWFTRKDGTSIEFCSVNPSLARQFRILLADVWVISTERSFTKKTHFWEKKYETETFFVYINEFESLGKIAEHCSFEWKRNNEKFLEIISRDRDYTNSSVWTIPLCAFKERTVPWVWHQTTYWWIRKPRYNFQRWKCKNYGIEHWLKYNWCKVVSVEDVGVQNVIHIEVDWDHTYWGELDLTHNTFLWAGYLAGRQMMLPMQTIIYIVPTLRNHAKPAWRALSHYFWECPEFKMNKSDFSIVNTATKSEMHFITAERGDSIRGNAANLLIIDEAAFIDEDIYTTAEALVRTTKGMVYGISTVNPETPKNWFYYNLIDAEIDGYDPNSVKYARRITLPQNPFIPNEEKEMIMKDGMRNPAKFNCEYMVSFADKDSFDLSKFWIIDEDPTELTIDGSFVAKRRGEALSKEIFSTYQSFILSYDGAKRKDKPWVSVWWVKPTGWIDCVMSDYLEWLDYWWQVEVLYEIYKMLWWEKKVEWIIDYGGAGVAVEEIIIKTKGIYPICIQSVGGMYEGKEGGIWRVGKELLIGKTKSQMTLWTVRGFSFMKKLNLEFETYTEDVKRIAWATNHWDILSSAFNAIWYADKVWYLEKKDPTKQQQVWDWEFGIYNNPDLLYNDEVVDTSTDPFERYAKFGF